MLPEITIEAYDPSPFMPGGAHWELTTDSLPLLPLNQLLAQEFALYFVDYGAKGQLSSANLRGLGAARTSLIWEGMEINSFTLGQSDFGEIMMAQGYEVGVGFGALSALYGNGAIGGSIALSYAPDFQKRPRLSLTQQMGSFGEYAAQVGFRTSTKKIHSNSVMTFQKSDNDFPYAHQDQEVRQMNAGFQNLGVLQDLYFQINPQHMLSLHFWYQDFEREIQPQRNDFQNDDHLENNTLRTVISWNWLTGRWQHNTAFGYTRDDQRYNKVDRILVSRHYLSYDFQFTPGPKIQFKAGTQANLIRAKVNAFKNTIHESRWDFYGSGLWKPLDGLRTGLSIRVPQVSGEFKPVSPMLSVSYDFRHTETATWTLDGQFARSFRLPTLNDRYWQPGGNLDLQPELSRNWELGVELDSRSARIHYQGALRYYYHSVDNWIIWIPGGSSVTEEGEVLSFWYPDNIRKVLAQGMEFYQSIRYQKAGSSWSTKLNLQANYKKAVNKKAISNLDRSVNKQLPYTPKWSLNGSWWVYYNHWSAALSTQFQDSRFTEANNELPALPGYTLWNLLLSRQGKWKKLAWSAQLQLNNILDKDYENFENRAMPGRNYSLNLIFTYN